MTTEFMIKMLLSGCREDVIILYNMLKDSDEGIFELGWVAACLHCSHPDFYLNENFMSIIYSHISDERMDVSVEYVAILGYLIGLSQFEINELKYERAILENDKK